MEEKTMEVQREQSRLIALAEWEEIVEKKSKIYSRLLTDTALAKTREEVSARHEERRMRLLTLAYGKSPKKQNGQGRYEMNGGNTEK